MKQTAYYVGSHPDHNAPSKMVAGFWVGVRDNGQELKPFRADDEARYAAAIEDLREAMEAVRLANKLLLSDPASTVALDAHRRASALERAAWLAFYEGTRF